MYITLKTKIWLTVLAIVLLFTSFTLFYFPEKQGELLLKNYNNEIQNLARTVALGVKIALDEQNYEGVQTAMEFVKESPGLAFVSLIQFDSTTTATSSAAQVEESVLVTYPEDFRLDSSALHSDSILVKRAPFNSHAMSGTIELGFSTESIIESKNRIRRTSLLVSGAIFGIGLLIGLWFSRSISVPVRALRDAVRRVGIGDLTAVIKKAPNDEIGELAQAFNEMVQDVSKARADLHESNLSLSNTNKLLNSTVEDLKATQSQLIQSEKMASLGELTAGIAHEIQNPLNFVNNFSELNIELLDEMKQEIDAGNQAEVIELAKILRDNQEKINFHGKRADSIVKGMLQHSRSSTGIKEPVDLNALADEYLRLAYHGMRAKDKSFQSGMETDFDPSIGLVKVVPQDMGRVILNLITNAFYAVNEKRKSITPSDDFKPTVSVRTSKTGSKVLLSVKDNGSGIPQSLLDKVFQPFFTTKPTGQGTGLGLSISYDIIKAHGGELKVETQEGQGTEFQILLPVN